MSGLLQYVGTRRLAEDVSEHAAANTAIFLVLSLVLGLISRNVLSHFVPFPYTVVLLVFGMIVGGISHAASGSQFEEAVNVWASIEPHAILIVFLPLLIFESAFSIDFHVFRRSFWQIFTLAFPGVALGAVMTAAVAVGIFPYGWNWTEALLFGSILAATDPVAVVALLKELGASKSLEILIEGESLLNDGTAIVAFTIFRDVLLGVDASAGEVFGTSLQLVLGGPILGLLACVLCVWILSYIFNDAMSEVTLTLIACYSVFVLAEGTALHTSGVLALVTLGVLMSAYGKPRISPEVEGAMHSFWEMMSYIANTIVFALAGVIIAEKTFFSEFIGIREWGFLAVLWIFLQLIRFVVVLVSAPVLVTSGYRVDWRTGLVLSWAGLRGAVSLTLALLVEQDEGLSTAAYRQRVLFYVAGTAALTLLINASTTKPLLVFLGMQKQSEAGKRLYERAAWKLHRASEERIEELQANPLVAQADWKQVWSYIPVYTRPVYLERLDRGTAPRTPAEVEALPPRMRHRWERYNLKFFESTPRSEPNICSRIAAAWMRRFPQTIPASSSSSTPHDGATVSKPNPIADLNPINPARPQVNSLDSDHKEPAPSPIPSSPYSDRWRDYSPTPSHGHGTEERKYPSPSSAHGFRDSPVTTTTSDHPMHPTAGASSSRAERVDLLRDPASDWTSSASSSSAAAKKPPPANANPRVTTSFASLSTGRSHRPSRDAMLLEAVSRRRFAIAAQALTRHRFEEGFMSKRALTMLLEAESWQVDGDKARSRGLGATTLETVDAAGQAQQLALTEWEDVLGPSLQAGSLVTCLSNSAVARPYVQPLLLSHFELAYDAASAFVDIHNEVCERSSMWATSDEVADTLIAESRSQTTPAAAFVESIELGFPELVQALQTKRAVRAMLSSERHFIQRLLRDGGLDEKQGDHMLETNNTSTKKLHGHPTTSTIPSAAQQVERSALLRGVSPELRAQVIERATTRFLAAGDVIFRQGDAPESIFLLLSGTLEMTATARSSLQASAWGYDVSADSGHRRESTITAAADEAVSKALDSVSSSDAIVLRRQVLPGDVAGALAVLAGTMRPVTLTAKSHVQILEIDLGLVAQLLESSPAFADNLWRGAALFVAQVFLDTFRRETRIALTRAIESATVLYPFHADPQEADATSSEPSTTKTPKEPSPPSSSPAAPAPRPPGPQIGSSARKASRMILSTMSNAGIGPDSVPVDGLRAVAKATGVPSTTIRDKSEIARTANAAGVSKSAVTKDLVHIHAVLGSATLPYEDPPHPSLVQAKQSYGSRDPIVSIGHGLRGWILLEQHTAILLRGRMIQRGKRGLSVAAFHTIHPCPEPLRFVPGSVLVVIPKSEMLRLRPATKQRSATVSTTVSTKSKPSRPHAASNVVPRAPSTRVTLSDLVEE